jgi:NAD(P)H-nitrite reductase large subunit
MIIVGNGGAGAECIIALRESGYHKKIHLFTDSKWPVSNPMLTSYYLAGKIGFDGLFPFGSGLDFYSKYGVDVHPESPVTILDAEQKVAATKSGLELKYDKCLIATGAAAALPPVEGMGSERVYTLRTVEDALRLKEAMAEKPKKALVIGASMVGIKLVELFYNAGVEVCLADLAPHIFPLAAHPDCARIIEERLLRKGIKLRFGAAVEKVADTVRGINVYFKGDTESEEANLVLMCTGVQANTGFINRNQVAVDKGILVDGYMRTTMPDLYAAGDVAQVENPLTGERQIIGLWANARYQGRTAGRNMAGENEFLSGSIPHNISHFMGMDFVSIGDVSCHDRIEQKYDEKKIMQLFWKEGLLTGANFLDSYTESGVIKNALTKGLKNCGSIATGSLPVIQNWLTATMLREVKK